MPEKHGILNESSGGIPDKCFPKYYGFIRAK